MPDQQAAENALRILVAEDNTALGVVLRFNLQRAGFDVTLTRNGREAWEKSQTQSFDLVISDHQMPEMTGTEFCQRLRQSELNHSTPLIFLTAKALEIDLRRILDELGVTLVMPKPFSPADLLTKVESCLAAHAE